MSPETSTPNAIVISIRTLPLTGDVTHIPYTCMLAPGQEIPVRILSFLFLALEQCNNFVITLINAVLEHISDIS